MKDKTIDLDTTKMGRHLIKIAELTPQLTGDFADQVATAKKILEDSTVSFREEVLLFTANELPNSLEKVRSWRMTIERETSLTLRALEDLRKFFLGDIHEKEMTRLKDFVTTCEIANRAQSILNRYQA